MRQLLKAPDYRVTAPDAWRPEAAPVSAAVRTNAILTVEGQDYRWRPARAARFPDPAQHPSRDDESAHFLLHESDPDDPDYRRFLSRRADPLLARSRGCRCAVPVKDMVVLQRVLSGAGT